MGKSALPKKSESKAEAYVVKHPHLVNKTWTLDQINAHADLALDYFRDNKDEITISRYFTINLIPKRSYSEWSTRSEYFGHIWEILKAEQKERLANMLMSRDNSTAGIIFAMKNVSGWRDNPETADDDEHELRDEFEKTDYSQ